MCGANRLGASGPGGYRSGFGAGYAAAAATLQIAVRSIPRCTRRCGPVGRNLVSRHSDAPWMTVDPTDTIKNTAARIAASVWPVTSRPAR